MMRMMRMSKTASVLALVLLSSAAYAQGDAGNDEVALKNGGSIRGTVVSSEPGVSVKVIELGQKETRTIPWEQVAGVQRDKFAPKTITEPANADPPYGGYGLTPSPMPIPVYRVPAPPTPVPVPESVPVPPLGSPGVVRLHIDSPVFVQVRSRTYGIQLGASPLVPVCASPCDKIIDGSRGDLFEASGEFSGASHFGLSNMRGDVELTVRPESKGLALGGSLMDVFGTLGILAGTGVAIGGAASGSSPTYDANGNKNGTTASSLIPIGIGTALGGVAMLAGGIIMGVYSSTTFDLHQRGVSASGAKARYWMGEF